MVVDGFLMLLYKNRIVITGGTGRFGLELKKINNFSKVFNFSNRVGCPPSQGRCVHDRRFHQKKIRRFLKLVDFFYIFVFYYSQKWTKENRFSPSRG